MLLDVADGHLRIEQEAARYAVNLDLVPTEITENDLLRWLDERLRDSGLGQSERLAWLARVLRWLQREGGYTLTALYRHRSRLCEALLERLRALLASGRQRGFQQSLLIDEPQAGISADYRFRFQPGAYPARPPYYQGRFVLSKHYYGVIGDLRDPPPRQTDHEMFCADAIDKSAAVRHWVRNLPGNPEFSFWLPIPSGRFYPDFVAELNDGRALVVEYKGEGYKSNDDSVVKRQIGETWAKVSGNLFLFAVERDADGRDVAGQLRHLLGNNTSLAEHAPVRLVRALVSEGAVAAGGGIGYGGFGLRTRAGLCGRVPGCGRRNGGADDCRRRSGGGLKRCRASCPTPIRAWSKNAKSATTCSTRNTRKALPRPDFSRRAALRLATGRCLPPHCPNRDGSIRSRW